MNIYLDVNGAQIHALGGDHLSHTHSVSPALVIRALKALSPDALHWIQMLGATRGAKCGTTNLCSQS